MTGRLYVRDNALPDALAINVATPLVTSPNLAPRQGVSTIRWEQGERRLTPLFWGLTPPWLEVLDHAPHCARAETLDARPMFRDAFQSRRCLIPVNGFYVWKIKPRSKQPYLITHVQRTPLLLAGLWCRYHTTLTEFTDSMALITVPANLWLSPLTDRLPALVAPNDMDQWLHPETDIAKAKRQLTPAPLKLLGAFPVSKHVNNPAYQSPACAHPVGPMLQWASP
ncbi:SOS response-associated peptidase [Halomonas vilamensis]|uniref:Abasic site processing protein n=1 Tax=Vreelandella vilamensis TaxID=531309 RepID=A0ABU1H0I8_9GAMM|nr:SOS response-associated peptidase [Halomonas vilamensis]MDR5897811.1 SOS response-associated peptidase [Halomonas vilamensis]